MKLFNIMDQNIIIPILGILTGIIIPVSVFIWQYYEGKGKRETILEISKHLDDAAKLEELLEIFEDRKKNRLSAGQLPSIRQNQENKLFRNCQRGSRQRGKTNRLLSG